MQKSANMKTYRAFRRAIQRNLQRMRLREANAVPDIQLNITPPGAPQAAQASGGADMLKKLTLAGASAVGLSMLVKKIKNDTRRKALIDDLMMYDPVIKDADKTTVLEYYATIVDVAPSVSLNKHVVKELLQTFIKFGRIDISTIKMLAETDDKVQKNLQLKPALKVKDFLG